MNPKQTLSRRIWIGIILLAFTGQLAWGVRIQSQSGQPSLESGR